MNKHTEPYSMNALEALRAVHPPGIFGASVALLMGILVVTAIALIFAPWQQTATGSGRVIAFSPSDREQRIEAPIAGVVVEWLVQEGQRVEAGDVLGEISDNDPQIMARLAEGRAAALRSLEASSASVRALDRKIIALEAAQAQGVAGARARLGMGKNRAMSAMQAVEAALAGETTAKLNQDRQRALEEKGLTSVRAREAAELKYSEAKAKLASARMGLSAAQGEVIALKAEVDEAIAQTAVEVEKARSYIEDSRSKEAKAAASLVAIDTRLSRQASMTLTAKRSGTIVKINVRPGGEVVKAGDPIAVFLPDTADRSVEMWVDGNDAPLIAPGTKARLQFEGWPAIQFSGWPSVAVGTFGGVVALVDATIGENGKVRVLVVPDPEDISWPTAYYLRQGGRVGGWLLLGEVSLGYEIWRRANGFPPVASKGVGPNSKSEVK